MTEQLKRQLAFSIAVSCTFIASTGADSAPFYDATDTHVPAAPALHALDSVFLDADHDGDLDVVVAVERGKNALYINLGNGRLEAAADPFGPVARDNEHVRTADFDGDGNADVIFVAEDDQRHGLFLGRGDGTFVDASERLPATSQANGLAVGDVNGDGLYDVVVGNTGEVAFGTDATYPARNFLWLNDPDRPGHFIDATRTNLPDTDDQAEGVALADMDNDGDLDMLVASPSRANRLLINDGQGVFTDNSAQLELVVPLETREVHPIDANGDGLLDIVYFNLTSNNQGWDKDPQTRLLVNDGQGRYMDRSDSLPQHTFSSWGGAVIDFNDDGYDDLVVSAIQVPGFDPLRLRAWQNDGSGNFIDVTEDVIPQESVGRSWSIGKGDADGDGKEDLFIGQWGTQARLLVSSPARE